MPLPIDTGADAALKLMQLGAQAPGAVNGAGAAAGAAAAAAADAPVAGQVAVAAGAAAARSTGISGAGLFGFTAGMAGLGLTAFNVWKQTLGSTDASSLRQSGVLGPPTYAMGAGMGLLLLAEKGGLSENATGFLRTGSIALILGGLLGAVLGAIPTFYNPRDDRARNDPSIRKPTNFPVAIPAKVSELAGLELASAQVPTTKGEVKRLSIYLDPTTAKKTTATTLPAAIEQARAAVQADSKQFRSQAVVQTTDGAFWVAQLTGDLDQIDGRYYTDKNEFDARYAPQVVRRHPALQAVVGVATKVTFEDAPPAKTTPVGTPAGATTR